MTRKLYRPFRTPPINDVSEFKAFIEKVFESASTLTKQNKKVWDKGHTVTDINNLPHGIWTAIAIHTDPNTLNNNIKRIEKKYADVKAIPGHGELVARTTLRERTGEWCDAGHFSVAVIMGDFRYESHLRYDRRKVSGEYLRPGHDGHPHYTWMENIDEPPTGKNSKLLLSPGRSHYPAISRLGPFDLPQAFAALMLAEFAHHGSSGYYGYGLPDPKYAAQATCYTWACDVCFAGGRGLTPLYLDGNRSSVDIKKGFDSLRYEGYAPIGMRLKLFRNPFLLTGDNLSMRFKNVYRGSADFIVGMPDQLDILGKDQDRTSLKVLLPMLPWEKIRAECSEQQFPNVGNIEAAVFDLDKTLIGVDSTVEFVKYLIAHGLLSKSLQAKIGELSRKYEAGTIQPHEQPTLMAEILTHLEAKNANVMYRILHFVAHTNFKVRPVIHDMINAHRLLGHRIIIASASIGLIVHAVVEHCFPSLVLDEEDEILGANLKFNRKGGVYTLSESCGGEQKLQRVKKVLNENKIAHFAAYSDSINDLPLLEGAAFPMAVSPDKALGKHAIEKRWPIMLLPGDLQRLERTSKL